MNTRRQGFLALLALAACSTPEQTPSIDADLVIANVSVIAMADDSVQHAQSVFVQDGTIVAVAPAKDVSANETATVIDATDKFLIPGLADMHVHAWNDSEMPLYVVNGVTLVRNMWGEAQSLQLRDRIEAGETMGPRIVTAGRLTDGDPPVWGEFSGVARTPEEATQQMDEQREAGYDFFKIYALITLETFDGIAAHSKQSGFPFAGHVPAAVPLDHALESGMATIEHLTGWTKATLNEDSPYLTRRMEPDSKKRWANNTQVAEQLASGELTLDDLYDQEETRRLAELAAANGVWNVPTLSVNKRLVTSSRQAEKEFARPEMRFMSPQTVARWDPSSDFRLKDYTDDQLETSQIFFERYLELVRILHEAGTPLLAGTDAPNPFVLHGFAMHEELQLLVDAGLTPYEALVTATRAPAEFLGEADQFGTIAAGMRADLVLLDANPLQEIGATRAIDGVIVEGTWHSRQDLDDALEAVAASFALPDDWFAGVEPPDANGGMLYFDWTRGDDPVGASRAAIQVADDGFRTLIAQNRWRTGGELATEDMTFTLDDTTALADVAYSIDRNGTISSLSARIEDATVQLTALAADGTQSTQEMALPDHGVLMVQSDTNMVAMIPLLADLAVGETADFNVIVVDTFGVRLVEEQWSLTRNSGDQRSGAFSGTTNRVNIESQLSFSYDESGIVNYALIDQFGETRSDRRE